MSYYIEPPQEDIRRALEDWQWIGIGKKQPILVTAFADIFFSSEDGIWFLDTLEGSLKRTHNNRTELECTLSAEDGQDHYLFGGFVDRAVEDGVLPGPADCYDFKLHPKIGGLIDYGNVEVRNFVVALSIRGQLHEQLRELPDGARISKVEISEVPALKPWWKLW